MQVYLPDELYRAVKARALPASELLQEAVRAEVRRLELLAEGDKYLAELVARVGKRQLSAETDRYVEALIAEVGEPSASEVSRAKAIARRFRGSKARKAG